jgi:MFS family permease
LTIVDIFIVNIAIPSIQKGLKTTNADTQLIVAMYMIGFASFLIISGRAEIIMEEKAIYNWIVIFHDFLRKLWICSFTRTINFHEILPGNKCRINVTTSAFLYPNSVSRA